jgi:hypothetical protein
MPEFKRTIVRLQKRSNLEELRFRTSWLIVKHQRLAIVLLNIGYFFAILSQSRLSWPLFGDAVSYEEMARGISVDTPFTYRIIIPWIVSLFPTSIHQWVFLAITLISLVLSTILLFEYIQLKGARIEVAYLGVIVFMGSNVFQYHLLNFGLVDSAFLCLVITFLYLLELGKSQWTIPIIFIGFFVKESFLFLVPVLIVNELLKHDLRNTGLAILTGAILGVVTIIRQTAYSIAEIIENIEYNGINLSSSVPTIIIGILVAITLRALWAYGIILFSALLGFFLSSKRDKIILILLLCAFAVMAMLATDWNRMMFLPFPLIVFMGLLPFMSEYSSAKMQRVMFIVLPILAGIWFVLGPISWLYEIDDALVLFGLLSVAFGMLAILRNANTLRGKLHQFRVLHIAGTHEQETQLE